MIPEGNPYYCYVYDMCFVLFAVCFGYVNFVVYIYLVSVLYFAARVNLSFVYCSCSAREDLRAATRNYLIWNNWLLWNTWLLWNYLELLLTAYTYIYIYIYTHTYILLYINTYIYIYILWNTWSCLIYRNTFVRPTLKSAGSTPAAFIQPS